MPINENISDFIRRYKQEHNLSIAELSETLGISKNTAVSILNGTGNLCTSTIEIMAEKCGVSVMEIISAHPRNWAQAEIMSRTARLFGDLPPEQREPVVTAFLTLVDALSENDIS